VAIPLRWATEYAIELFTYTKGILVENTADKKQGSASRLSKHGTDSFYFIYAKRILDVLLTSIALVLFSWLYAILAIIVRVFMGTPLIYASERIGKDEKPFRIYKFRSMTNECDENGVLLPSPQRLGRFGRLLRSTSLDELPSAWNIICGDLSIIGPRPLPTKYLPYFYENERIRHTIRPGLSGWAQVNGRNAISWDDKFRYDAEYVEDASFWFDLKIMLSTVGKVIGRNDIIQDDQLTASLHIVRADMLRKEAGTATGSSEGV